MDLLDLRVMEIMDYSEGNRHVGNLELPKEIVDRYYKAFPDAIGFINGYGVARTFDLRDERPLISYDYYLGVDRSTDEAIAPTRSRSVMMPTRRPSLTTASAPTLEAAIVSAASRRLWPGDEVTTCPPINSRTVISQLLSRMSILCLPRCESEAP